MPNVFETNARNTKPESTNAPVAAPAVLRHGMVDPKDVERLFADAVQAGSLSKAIIAHHAMGDMPGLDEYLSHSIETSPTFPQMLLPEPHDIYKTPYLYNRRTEWVAKIMNGVRKTPFSRIRTRVTDITGELARARGYMKGNFKEEQVINMSQRVTTPYTTYIKQRMDRDDLLDITDLDMVALLKNEMDIKYDEERARAMLLSDGRAINDPDKIREDCIRPILKEDDFFTIRQEFEQIDDVVDGMLAAKEDYRGGGNITAFMSYANQAHLLTKRDSLNHRLYKNVGELADEMGVNSIVTCPYMDNDTIIALDLDDYCMGANKNSNKSWFQDFDINYNEFVYLLEARFCGALVVPKSAIIFTKETD